MTDSTNRDLYQTITNKIVAAIEAGAGQWRMPWHNKGGTVSSVQPVNINGRRYRGMNTILLWSAAQEKGYDSAVWATYKMWQAKGAQVRKGEKATEIIFWKSFDVTVVNPDTKETTREKRLVARGYSVFNVSQVDNYKPKEMPIVELPLIERIAHCEKFFAAIPAEVRHGGNQAYCSRMTGHIQIPDFDAFNSPEDYYSTRGHESVHWSGHTGRLDRVFGKRFGDDAYAFEELVAELGAAFLCGHLAISNEPRPDHAAYLQSWLARLRSDKRAIFTAASLAQKACDFLIALAGDESAEDDDNEESMPLAA